jgi:hypothetical protein
MKSPANYNELIEKYLNGSLVGQDLVDFEKEMAENEFLFDAVEGYQSTSASVSDLDSVKKKIVANPNKKIINLLIYSGIAASITIALFYIFQSNIKSGLYTIRSQKDNTTLISSNHDTTNVNDTNIIDINPDIKSYTAELIQVPKNVIVPESIAPLHINKNIKIENNNDINFAGYYKYKSNHLYSYINDYKVIDYRYDKRQNRKNSAIPSNIIEFEQENDYAVQRTEITYLAFLEQAIDKFSQKKYYDAVEDFNIILDQYPDDANALYYKALCFYETNDNNKSINLFNKALEQDINTFHEESMWYKGLILKEEQQYAAAEKVLEEIVNEQGYYGVQAKKELDELYKIYLNE